MVAFVVVDLLERGARRVCIGAENVVRSHFGSSMVDIDESTCQDKERFRNDIQSFDTQGISTEDLTRNAIVQSDCSQNMSCFQFVISGANPFQEVGLMPHSRSERCR